MQFLQIQASVLAPQAPNIKSECTQDPEVFIEKESFIEQIHERFKTFGISLNLKITLNLDRMPTLEIQIAYTFSRTSETAQGYIASKIQTKYYPDQIDIFQDLKNTFSNPDLEFYAQHKLIILCQANRSFFELYTKLSKYIIH